MDQLKQTLSKYITILSAFRDSLDGILVTQSYITAIEQLITQHQASLEEKMLYLCQQEFMNKVQSEIEARNGEVTQFQAKLITLLKVLNISNEKIQQNVMNKVYRNKFAFFNAVEEEFAAESKNGIDNSAALQRFRDSCDAFF